MMRKLIFSTKVFAVTTLIFNSFSSTLTAQPPEAYVLPAGTRMRVRMETEVSSKVNSVGDTFIVRTTERLTNLQRVSIPVGTAIEGRVAKLDRAGLAGDDGELEIEFTTLRLGRDDTLVFKARMTSLPKPPSDRFFKAAAIGTFTALGAMFGSMAKSKSGVLLGSLIGAGSGAGAAMIKKGRNVTIRSNEEFEIELTADVVFPAREF